MFAIKERLTLVFCPFSACAFDSLDPSLETVPRLKIVTARLKGLLVRFSAASFEVRTVKSMVLSEIKAI